jgi:hypothetical protein
MTELDSLTCTCTSTLDDTNRRVKKAACTVSVNSLGLDRSRGVVPVEEVR